MRQKALLGFCFAKNKKPPCQGNLITVKSKSELISIKMTQTKKYFLKTFGCQMNFSDSERIASFLEKLGLEPAKSPERADLLFSTLAVFAKLPKIA